ncbi:Kelch domain-containing protein 10 [Thelohanellus kitauei]|uniref:Kelch domain-containing protein 10 n=1 Tax=Thelohanellus kitauei TaxID=669202 RepID=A0A0C2IJL6_THEKT|nr:Kelch domain-containing protein 10 [Thelohanellus kitauei]
MTSVREFLFIYGGYNFTTFAHYNDFLSYNTISCVWKRYQLPHEKQDTCVHSSICSDGKFVYLFGGSYGFPGSRQNNTLVSFDITNETWEILFHHTDVCDQNTPPPMYRNLLFYHKGSLYVLGGCDRSLVLDTMYKFCLQTLTWSLVVQNGLKPQRLIGGTVYENQIYLFESLEPEINRFREVSIFDFSTHTWTKRETIAKNQQYPDTRICESFAFSKNFGWISGGNIMTTYRPFYDIWKIDLQNLEWLKADYTLGIGIFDHCTSIVDDCYLFSFGGQMGETDRDNTFRKIIIRPPTLYRRCLETVSRSLNVKSLRMALPPSILDDLNLNSNS